MEPWVALLFSVTALYIIVTGRAETTISLIIAMVNSVISGSLFSYGKTKTTPNKEELKPDKGRDYTPKA